MKKTLLVLSFALSFYLHSNAQGISFSYLIPQNGYLSAPISPFSIRGLGIGSYVGIESGFTLYNVPGLAMEDLPFTYDKPLTGPHMALLIPIELFAKLPLGPVNLKVMAGGFGWWNINTRINEGNMDRAFREFEGWEVLNTDFSLNDKIAIGWMAGMELEFLVSDKFSITTEAQYLNGTATSSLSGSYTGGVSGSPLETKSVDLPDAQMVLRGVEISLGVQFKSR